MKELREQKDPWWMKMEARLLTPEREKVTSRNGQKARGNVEKVGARLHWNWKVLLCHTSSSLQIFPNPVLIFLSSPMEAQFMLVSPIETST